MSQHPFQLTGRRALVTGGSKGIGEAIAIAFAQAGADVMITSRTTADLERAAEKMKAAGTPSQKIRWLQTDMTNRTDVDQLATAAIEQMGGIDILINNAGGNVPQNLQDIDDDSWDRMIELNLTSCIRLAKAASKTMTKNGWGRIIYIASIMGSVGAEGRSAYCATKAALIGASHAQAVELGPHGVTVNCISPGPILTDLPRNALSQQQQDRFTDATALARWGEPEEIAGPALLLASDSGSYITGANLTVDGGVTIKGF